MNWMEYFFSQAEKKGLNAIIEAYISILTFVVDMMIGILEDHQNDK